MPTPGSLSTRIFPACSWMMPYVTESPVPFRGPAFSGQCLRGEEWIVNAMKWPSSGAMPEPVSLTNAYQISIAGRYSQL